MNGNGDTVFEALADGQRRQLLLGLEDHDPHHVTELSGATREMAEAHETLLQEYLSGDLAIPAVDDELLRMHRVTVPKLIENDFIEWDHDAHIVTKGPQFDELKPYLELLDGRRDERPPQDIISLRR